MSSTKVQLWNHAKCGLTPNIADEFAQTETQKHPTTNSRIEAKYLISWGNFSARCLIDFLFRLKIQRLRSPKHLNKKRHGTHIAQSASISEYFSSMIEIETG